MQTLYARYMLADAMLLAPSGGAREGDYPARATLKLPPPQDREALKRRFRLDFDL